MDDHYQTPPLPEKVLRRHCEILREILPDFSRMVLEEGRPADVLLNHYLRNHREMGSRDRRFLSQALFSYFRWYGWSVARLALEPVDACLLGVLLDSTALPASFALARSLGNLPAAAEPIGDLTLADKLAAVTAWFEDRDPRPLLTDLLPPDFARVVEPEAATRCIEQYQQRPPTWIRTRVDAGSLGGILEKSGIPCRAHPYLPNALAVESGANLSQALAGQAGQFVVQDISSQCVGSACAPSPGEEWWDCCGGAGGKSLQLMDLMGQDGKLLATDVRPDALRELKKRARRYGIRGIRTQPFNAATDEPFRKTFDGVLVDAPCSGWGTWGRNPDARWRTSQREVVQCAQRQLKILDNAKWCVKPGGALVYAVCTLTRPETEEAVMNFLDHHPDFSLDPFINPLTGSRTDGQLQVWPWDGPGDAMFIARFVRNTEEA